MTIVNLNIEIDEQLKNDFRADCVKKGRDMKDVLPEIISAYIKQKRC